MMCRSINLSGVRIALYLLSMGVYQKFVVPHLINFAMSNKESARCRSQIIPAARGGVLEVGVGSGLNLRFYRPREVTQVCGVDPSPELLKMARKKTKPAVSSRVTEPIGRTTFC